MSGPARRLVAVFPLIVFIAVWFTLLRSGIYGWTMFVVLSALLGGLGAWIFRPTTAWRAAGLGALTVAGGTCFLLLLGAEGRVFGVAGTARVVFSSLAYPKRAHINGSRARRGPVLRVFDWRFRRAD